MTPAHALVGLPRPEIAKASIVPNDMIADFEAGIHTPSELDLAAMQLALEAAGVEFIEDGVKFRKGRK